MPKQTFFNLPREKSDHIMHAAIAAFSERGYHDTSITCIVDRAGIAKGSFYQYFEDKDDLYLHILHMIAKRKLDVFKREFAGSPTITLTQFMRKTAHLQLLEFKEVPELTKIGMELARNMHEPIAKKFIESINNTADSLYIGFIENEKLQGRLDRNVDSRMLNYMLTSIANYIIERIEGGNGEIESAFVDEVYDKLEYILTNGIYGG
ncbi:MAG: TetR/AcrR family transcriptional regulator [Oscillospiraceae bacterium]|nr:TetR/AcrR family transcriptional regulator [Oscillospiraceae bacterium]